MNYGIFDPSLSIASIIMDYNNYNRINWCNSIWVFNLCAFLPEWSLNCTESESNIAAIVSWNTNGVWSASHAKLGVKLGIWYQRIGCKVLNHEASQIEEWVGLGGPRSRKGLRPELWEKSRCSWWPADKWCTMKSSADIVNHPQQPQGLTNTFLGAVEWEKSQETPIKGW